MTHDKQDKDPRQVIDELVDLFLETPMVTQEASIPTGRVKEGISEPTVITEEVMLKTKERFFKFRALINDLDTGPDNYWVLCLFQDLEKKALREIGNYAALAQTTNPDRVKEQCPEIPDLMIDNAKATMRYQTTLVNSKKGKNSKYSKEQRKDILKFYQSRVLAEEKRLDALPCVEKKKIQKEIIYEARKLFEEKWGIEAPCRKSILRYGKERT